MIFLQRQLWLKVHLYLALTLGFFFALMGLTGSVSVYRAELDELFNPRLVITEPQAKRQSLDHIMAAVHKAHPDLTGSWTLEMPNNPHGMITAWYDKPAKTYFELYAPLMVSVNPYTAKVVDSRYWGHTLTTWLLDLHTQLRLNQFGWNAVGCLGVLLLLSLSSGVYLWLSDARRLWQKFTVCYDRGLMRLLFDSHRLLAILFTPSLLLLALTGINLSFPSLAESLVGASGMAHAETGKVIVSTGVPNKRPTSLEAAEFIARSVFPRAELRRISTPVGQTGVYRINFYQTEELNHRHPFTTVWVDHWNGQIKDVRNPQKFSTGETLISSFYALHSGEALGTWGRFLWFLSGIVLFFLYVSGVVYWLYRQGKVQDKYIDWALLYQRSINYAKHTYHIALPTLQLVYQQLRTFYHEQTRR